MVKYLIIAFILFGCARANEPVGPREMAGAPSAPPVKENTKPLDLTSVMAVVRTELGEDYIVDYLEPYVIAGNITQSEFDRIKYGTIRGCSSALYQDYFANKPDYVLKVYLFKDAATYEAYCQSALGRKSSSPYGFYSDERRSLIMNIGTGTGTLVHEMVHALIKPDFPDAPAWFNEGLGSLYEQCRIEDTGSLRGLINWRYQGLMDAVKSGEFVPLKTLCSTSDTEFYADKKAVNYAQARYFCLYLQQEKVLPKFYKQFRDRFTEDKTGIKFIEELLGKGIDAIDAEWREWIKIIRDINELR